MQNIESDISATETVIETDVDWRLRANCRGKDLTVFFLEVGGNDREAKECCYGCEVKSDCLQYALENKEKFGIWGGLSERERRLLGRAALKAEV